MQFPAVLVQNSVRDLAGNNYIHILSYKNYQANDSNFLHLLWQNFLKLVLWLLELVSVLLS